MMMINGTIKGMIHQGRCRESILYVPCEMIDPPIIHQICGTVAADPRARTVGLPTYRTVPYVPRGVKADRILGAFSAAGALLGTKTNAFVVGDRDGKTKL